MSTTPPSRDPWVPAGHFYSPIPSREDIRRHYGGQTSPLLRHLPGIDMNEAGQMRNYAMIRELYGQERFPEERCPEARYYARNEYYNYGDAFVLYAVLRLLRPKRVIEVGSGFSSCVTLDTNDRHFGGSIRCTFIEPHPERLTTLLRPADLERHELIQRPVQELDPSFFRQLTAKDVLFIDSSHVSKAGSDVNYLLFEALPALESGVWIHFHDVFWPFEYPREWVEEGRAWNEAYIVRAFLQYNTAFRVEFSARYMAAAHAEQARRELPRCMEDLGSHLWLSKV